MTPERWQQVKRLFDEAADLGPGEREAFLGRTCAGDDGLRAEVLSLFESEEREVPIVDGDVFEVFGRLLSREPGDDREGLRLGNYRILREIGRGGMAVVYAAERADDEYRQKVAIKLIRRGMDTDLMIARFRQERQILANLDHPGIAKLFDGGVTRDGLPYLVMEQIDGEPIDEYCDRRRLSIHQRLELFRTVCAAVQYAHRNLIVHRDLKPSNILVTSDGSPKLLDFGIAKLIELEPSSEDLELTAGGPRPMTPEYASPEQVLDQVVTTASDVYALGVLLYRLLTGRRPYRIESLTRSEIERVICEQDPERPSTAIARAVPRTAKETPPLEIAERRRSTPRELRKKLRGDLDSIVLRAMRKESEYRYGSAEQLAEDVRRCLEGLPVSAHEGAFGYRAGKFIRRHRIGVTAAALVFLSLLAGIVATTWQARVARQERLTAQKVSEFLVDLFELSDPEKARGQDIAARTLLERSAEEIDRLQGQPEVQAALMDTIGRVYLNLGMLDDAESMLGKALEIRREILGTDDPALADSESNLADLLAARARYDEAEGLHRKALDLRRRSLNASDERIALSEVYLARVLEHQSRYDEAEVHLREALARQRRTFGEEHEMVALTLNNLALVLRSKGRHEEAVELYRRALEMHRHLLGGDHPEVAVSLNNLAAALCQLGETDEARSLFKEAEELERRVLGEEHWNLAKTWNNHAVCLRSMGDMDGAEELYRASYELWRESLGPDHPYVAASLNNLGQLLSQTGRHEEAEELFRQALETYRQVPGGPHLDMAVPLNNLAMVLHRSGALEEAESLYQEALVINRQRYGDVHERVALNLNNLGELARGRGDTEGAKRYFREALALRRQLLGDVHLGVARLHLYLAHMLFAEEDLEEAAAEYRSALEIRRELLGESHRDVAIAAVGLGRALSEQQRPAEAEPHLRAAVSFWRSQTPERRQPGLAIAEAALGRCQALLGKYEEADALLLSSQDPLVSAFGADHSRAREVRQWLEWLYEVRRSSGGAPKEDQGG